MKKLRIVAALFLLSLALSPPTASGQASKAREIDAYVKSFADANQFYGVVLAMQDGKIVDEKAFGQAVNKKTHAQNRFASHTFERPDRRRGGLKNRTRRFAPQTASNGDDCRSN